MMIRQEIINRYEAEDGRVFKDEKSCAEYERGLVYKGKWFTGTLDRLPVVGYFVDVGYDEDDTPDILARMYNLERMDGDTFVEYFHVSDVEKRIEGFRLIDRDTAQGLIWESLEKCIPSLMEALEGEE